jgi:Ser/Thr protein kinase RdoA (MazF antagonist)
MVIFKEGRARKLRDEHERIKQWEAIAEGLAPRVYSFQERGETAALLVEYLPGRTVEQVLLQGDDSELDAALSSIRATLLRVWEKTRRDEPVRPKFLEQLSKRLRDLYSVHPAFQDGGGSIGTVRIPSFDELLERSATLDELLIAPFSVFIHGDFNVDNVIYDPRVDRVHFIDLHRSEQMDYVQDISVFLVSNLRLQALNAPVRSRIDHSVSQFYRFARDFAESAGDELFGARLALGLARSFATSTRFVLDPSTAKVMILKARFLLEKLASCQLTALESFSVPEEVLRG